MMLFRRKPKEKESPPEGVVPAQGSTSAGPEAKGAPGATGPPAAAAPPPLPRRAPESVGPAGASGDFTRCFVCGSTLDGGACPVCKIAWVE